MQVPCKINILVVSTFRKTEICLKEVLVVNDFYYKGN